MLPLSCLDHQWCVCVKYWPCYILRLEFMSLEQITFENPIILEKCLNPKLAHELCE